MGLDRSVAPGSWHGESMRTLDFDRTVEDLPPERAGEAAAVEPGCRRLHLAIAVLMVVLGDRGFSLPVSGFNISGPPGTELSEGVLTELFSVPLAWAVASLSLLSRRSTSWLPAEATPKRPRCTVIIRGGATVSQHNDDSLENVINMTLLQNDQV